MNKETEQIIDEILHVCIPDSREELYERCKILDEYLQSQLTEANKKTEAQRKLANGLIRDFLKREATLNTKIEQLEKEKSNMAVIASIDTATRMKKEIEQLTEENENLKCCGNCKYCISFFTMGEDTIIGQRCNVTGEDKRHYDICSHWEIRQPNQRRKTMNSRDKGANAERELSNKLKEYGYNTKRGQQFCGSNGDADVIGLPNIHIECKRVEKLNISNAMAQAKRDCKSGLPAVFHRKNREKWMVTMELDDWMKIYKNEI